MDVKEKRIKSLTLKWQRAYGANKLRLSSLLYREYYTYRFDSAMHYAQQEEVIARQMNDKKAVEKAKNHTAMLYAIGGYYSEGEKL